MNIKLFLMKTAARKGRRNIVRHVKKLGHIRGKEFMVPRDHEAPVMTYLYNPVSVHDVMPVVFNVHGGAWVGGDALLLDTQSQEMADRLGAMVVNINYTKVDEKPFPYPQYEVRDTVCYFVKHCNEYHIDPSRAVVMGYSAGGHLTACAVQLLAQSGIEVSSQVLCYPFLDFTFHDEDKNDIKNVIDGIKGFRKMFFSDLKPEDPLVSPSLAPEACLKKIRNTIIVTCGNDALKKQADQYEKRLTDAGCRVYHLDYPDAIHGFLECNYPETADDNEAKSDQQGKLCQQCDKDIADILGRIWRA